MQTFVPENSFANSVRVLDRQRLGKQRVETLQIMNALAGKSKGWTNHPATRMWRGYEAALLEYQRCTVMEWKARGYKDTCYDKINAHRDTSKPTSFPSWLGREDIHLSHKSKLIQKDPNFYKPFWPDAPDNLEHVWPIPLKGKG